MSQCTLEKDRREEKGRRRRTRSTNIVRTIISLPLSQETNLVNRAGRAREGKLTGFNKMMTQGDKIKHLGKQVIRTSRQEAFTQTKRETSLCYDNLRR